MFLNRSKPDDVQPLGDSEMTPGMKEKIDDMVKGWGEVTRGLRDAKPDTGELPLKVVRKVDVDYLMQALEDESGRIEDELKELRRQRNAEIAQKDAERSRLLREKERVLADLQAKADAQEAEINKRAHARVALLATVAKIDGSFDAAGILKNEDIRREVVRRKFGDAAVDGKSEAYIDERFESLEARVNVDPFARVLADGIKPALDGAAAAEKAWQDSVDYLRNAHKTRH